MAKPTQRELDLGYCEEAQTYCSVAEERYKQGATDMEKAKQIIIDALLRQLKKARADAIDEFANALINDGKVSAMRVLKVKEQLKEQKNDYNGID